MFARDANDRLCRGTPCEKCTKDGALHAPKLAPWGTLTHCPARAMKPADLQLGYMLSDAENGTLPFAGGMQQQPIRFIHAWRMLQSSGWLRYAKQKEGKDG